MMSGDRQERVGIIVLASAGRGDASDGALRATLQSLGDQTHSDLEIVVLHDGDPTIDVESLGARSVPARGEDPTRGAVGDLSARWIRFLPAGDRLAPRTLAAELAALRADPGAAIVFSRVERVDAGGAPVGDREPAPKAGCWAPPRLAAEVLEANPWPLGAALFDRELFLEIGGFDASGARTEEYDLWLRFLYGHAACVTDEVGLRHHASTSGRGADDAGAAESARVLLRFLRGERLESIIRALGGGERDAPEQGIARAELARRLLRTGSVALEPLVRRLVHEARAVGAYFPADAPFAELGTWSPELVRPEGWFLPPASGSPRPDPVEPSPRPLDSALRVAVATSDPASVARAERLRARRDDFAMHGVEVEIVHARREGDVLPRSGPDVEILRHRGSTDEIERVLVSMDVALVIADASHPARAVAEAGGWAVGDLPDVGSDQDTRVLAGAWLRAAASAAATRRRASYRAWRHARSAAEGGAFEEATCRTLSRALGAAAAAQETSASALEPRLSDARLDAVSVRRRLGEIDERSRRALDKLRIGRRLRSTFRSEEVAADSSAPVVSLDVDHAQGFLDRAAGAGGARLWVIYTTDPYSETHGQRSTWLARELLARGDHVVFFYWRWDPSESIPRPPHERLLPVPIDQFFRLQRPLMDLTGAGLQKLLLMEFPDAYLFEQVDFANAHGFTTIYDCVDDWGEFARAGQAHWYDPRIEAHLVRNARVVVATHPVLARRLSGMGPAGASIPVIPNGVALDSLAGAAPRARDGAPVVGYFGHLTPAWFDWELVLETARAHPGWSFEILGHGAPDDLDLPANVRVPGPVPHDELEARTRAWHVGIVPFRPGRLTQAVDPIKVYEYLALGLPAVVVDMPHLANAPSVYVCGRGEFAETLGRALESTPEREATAAFVEASTWEARATALLEVVETGVPRGAVASFRAPA